MFVIFFLISYFVISHTFREYDVVFSFENMPDKTRQVCSILWLVYLPSIALPSIMSFPWAQRRKIHNILSRWRLPRDSSRFAGLLRPQVDFLFLPTFSFPRHPRCKTKQRANRFEEFFIGSSSRTLDRYLCKAQRVGRQSCACVSQIARSTQGWLVVYHMLFVQFNRTRCIVKSRRSVSSNEFLHPLDSVSHATNSSRHRYRATHAHSTCLSELHL